MTKRFATSLPIDELLATKYSKKTENTDKYAWNLLTAYINEKKVIVNFNVPSSINALLCDFYATVRKEDGQLFTINSLNSIRCSLIRVIKKSMTLILPKKKRWHSLNLFSKQ